jgi:flagellar basal body rod protein FlgC
MQEFGLKKFAARLLSWLLALVVLLGLSAPPAYANLNDDHYDGNIFPLYAGNGSLVPPKVTLAEAMKRKRPVLLFFYVDDSSDCKKFVSVISRLDGYYGWAADVIPISVDRIPLKASYEPTEPGYYYKGYVPQTVVFDATGKVVLDAKGSVAYEEIDDVLREVFDLLPRSESVELRRRTVNEISTEVVEQDRKAEK